MVHLLVTGGIRKKSEPDSRNTQGRGWCRFFFGSFASLVLRSFQGRAEEVSRRSHREATTQHEIGRRKRRRKGGVFSTSSPEAPPPPPSPGVVGSAREIHSRSVWGLNRGWRSCLVVFSRRENLAFKFGPSFHSPKQSRKKWSWFGNFPIHTCASNKVAKMALNPPILLGAYVHGQNLPFLRRKKNKWEEEKNRESAFSQLRQKKPCNRFPTQDQREFMFYLIST